MIAGRLLISTVIKNLETAEPLTAYSRTHLRAQELEGEALRRVSEN